MTEHTAHIEWDVLNEYEDGLLSTTDASRVDAHLAECESCRAVHAELRRAIETMRAARPIEPPAELWTDIRSSITQTPRSNEQSYVQRRFSLTLPTLAAAALLLVVLSVSATLMLGRDATDGISTVASQDSSAPAVRLTSTDAQFIESVEALEKQLAAHRGKLRPQTVAILERSLKTIDDALLEARTALLADPANAALKDVLESTYRQKLDFLERATKIASAE